MMAWNSLPEAERRAKEREGIAAWRAWVEKHHGASAIRRCGDRGWHPALSDLLGLTERSTHGDDRAE
jgi:hypothetical protein